MIQFPEHGYHLKIPVPHPTSITTARLKREGLFRIAPLYASIRTWKSNKGLAIKHFSNYKNHSIELINDNYKTNYKLIFWTR